MAEIDYMEDYGNSGTDGVGSGIGKWANLSGAAVSLVLIGGLSVWGYQLLMRDVNGVPVVQAMEGAFRVAPEDPGGMRTPHQGLAVNEIAAVGGASGPADEVTLAPAPETLSDSDRPASALPRPEAEADGPVDAGTPAVEEGPAIIKVDPESTTMAEAESTPDAGEAVIADTPEGARATDLAVAQALMSAGGEDEATPTAEELALADAAGSATEISPRPVPRPATPAIAPTNASFEIADGADMPVPTEISATDLESSTALVQLGAFPTQQDAREEWIRLAGSLPAYFDGKRLVVQEAVSGGNTFYRLRAEGFEDLADTRRFCTELLARQTDCIPVELR